MVEPIKSVEPVIVLNDIRDKVKPTTDRVNMAPNIDSKPGKNMNFPLSKEKDMDPNKNKPVVHLEMLDPSVRERKLLDFMILLIIGFSWQKKKKGKKEEKKNEEKKMKKRKAAYYQV